MSKKVLIRKQAGSGGIMYTREVGGGQPGGFRQDLAALRGGAMGLNPQGGQSFIPGAQLPGAAPTRMQRMGAGANLAGRGLAAALTGLQTAYGLQGGNVGALGNIADTYAQQAQGLTRNNPTEAQQGQNMATEVFNQQQQQMANDAMMQQVNPAPTNQSGPVGNQLPGQSQGTQLGQLPPAGLPVPPVPAQATPAAPAAPAQQPAAPVDPTLSQTLGGFGFGLQTDQQTGTQLPPMQPQTPTGQNSVQTTLPQGQPSEPEEVVPQGQPYAGYPVSMMNNNRPINQQKYFRFLQGQQNKSFATYVLDEFSDMLHKADPHVAGLLAFRVYMNKVMR